jgi:hypothetical protein
VVGGWALALLVAASYLGFALFVVSALRSGKPVGTCGCFGRADTPPRPKHVVINALLATGAAAAASSGAEPLADASWPAWLLAPVLAAAFAITLLSSVVSNSADEGRQK